MDRKQRELKANSAKNDQYELSSAEPTQETDKELMQQFWKLVENHNKIIPITSLLSLLFGGSSIYFYLFKIDGLSIFAESISNSIVLVSITVLFLVITSVIWYSTFFCFLFVKRTLWRISIFLIIVVILFVLAVYYEFTVCAMKLAKYIEDPKDANWYLLDTRFITQNGLSKVQWGEIEQQGNGQSSNLSEIREKFNFDGKIDKENKGKEKKYPNAVYGYFAWNLGETKIFCPKDISIPDEGGNDGQKHTAADCLIIKGEYLQPIPNGLHGVERPNDNSVQASEPSASAAPDLHKEGKTVKKAVARRTALRRCRPAKVFTAASVPSPNFSLSEKEEMQ